MIDLPGAIAKAVTLLKAQQKTFEGITEEEDMVKLEKLIKATDELEKGVVTQDTINLLRVLEEDNRLAVKGARLLAETFDRDLSDDELSQECLATAQACRHLTLAFKRLTGLEPAI